MDGCKTVFLVKNLHHSQSKLLPDGGFSFSFELNKMPCNQGPKQMPKQMKEELIKILCEKSVKTSEEPVFKLVSGRMSDFYVNCKPTTLNPRGMYLIGNLVFDAIRDVNPRGVGGLTFGADPIAMASAFVSEIKGQPINAFSIRKTKKDHGISKWVEGDLQKGDRVVIIDDVATTGGSTIAAIERAREEGLEVAKVVVLVDRQEGGMENIREHIQNAVALITREELVEKAKRS